MSPAKRLLHRVLDDDELGPRLLPWEAQSLRQGRPPRRAKTATAEPAPRKTDAFELALAEALALATEPRHVMALSRVYAQATAPKKPRKHDTKVALEAAVRDCEEQYRAALAAAAAETPTAATARKLIIAIRRLQRASETFLARHPHSTA
ncbi:MAG: hypothetical protein AAF711_18025 [Planctomycetota bacterium]